MRLETVLPRAEFAFLTGSRAASRAVEREDLLRWEPLFQPLDCAQMRTSLLINSEHFVTNLLCAYWTPLSFRQPRLKSGGFFSVIFAK
jgi:hypothetical protein